MRGAVVLAAVVLASAGAPLVACALDFNRYDATDASTEASTDDASSDAAPTDDAVAEASPRRDAGSPCTAPASCLQQGTSCGSACGQNYRQCVMGCVGPMCMPTCTSTEQSCLGKCASACIGCTQDGGCAASSACLAASHP
jgi:hypothetical protein